MNKMNKMNNIKDWKSFNESTFDLVSKNKMDGWSVNSIENDEKEILNTKKVLSNKKSRELLLLDFMNDNGYTITVEKGYGTAKNQNYEYMGQKGNPYFFSLQPTWNDKLIEKELVYNYGNVGDVIFKIFKYELIDILKNVSIGMFVDFEDDKGKLIDVMNYDFDIEENVENVNIVLNNSSSYDVEENVKWISFIPYKFQQIPIEGSHEYRLLCEYGLENARNELIKLIKATNSNDYTSFLNKGINEIDNYTSAFEHSDGEVVGKYMTMSDIHISKNSELFKVAKTNFMLYKTHKLINDIHSGDDYLPIDKSLVERFIKLK